MFTKNGEKEYRNMLPGIEMKTLVHGDKTLLGEFRLKQGHAIPPHHHVHEQIGYLVAGKLRFTVGEETFEAEQGDSWCIVGDQEHSVQVLEDSLVVEVFSPVRVEYLP